MRSIFSALLNPSRAETAFRDERTVFPVRFSDLNQYGHCQGITLNWCQIWAVRNRPQPAWKAPQPATSRLADAWDERSGLAMPPFSLFWQCVLSSSQPEGALAAAAPRRAMLFLCCWSPLSRRGSPFVAKAAGDQTRPPDQIKKLAVSNRGSFFKL